MKVQFQQFGNTIAPLKWEAGSRVFNRLYYVKKGSASYRFQGKEHILKHGYLYLFPNNLEYELSQKMNDRLDHMYFDFFTIPPISMSKILEISEQEDSILWSTINILEILTKSIPFSSDMEQIKHVVNYFNAILEYIGERYQIEFISNKAIQTTVAYIYKHYNEPITVPELAALVYQNPNYFIRLFNKNMGITPYQYIRDVRLGNAVALLRQGFSVKEAALMVGFQNPSSLSHALKDVEK